MEKLKHFLPAAGFGTASRSGHVQADLGGSGGRSPPWKKASCTVHVSVPHGNLCPHKRWIIPMKTFAKARVGQRHQFLELVSEEQHML